MSDIGVDVEKGAAEASRTKRLKQATRAAHEALDSFIMSAKPFESRDNFAGFLKTQYLFHKSIDDLFFNDKLDMLLPDLKGRRRISLIERDLQDLAVEQPGDNTGDRIPKEPFDLPEAMGWLYVSEGSNLGAAFLLKDAAKLGLHEDFGARHLAGAPEGRGLYWRSFTAALDDIPLNDEEEKRVVAGAKAAFAAVHDYARRMMA